MNAKATFGYMIAALGFLGELGDLLKVFPLPKGVAVGLAAAGIAAVRFGHLAPAPVKGPLVLEPTPIDIDDGGAELGNASGEAGQAAAKGPFHKS